jgi:hypothetical protein
VRERAGERLDAGVLVDGLRQRQVALAGGAIGLGQPRLNLLAVHDIANVPRLVAIRRDADVQAAIDSDLVFEGPRT